MFFLFGKKLFSGIVILSFLLVCLIFLPLTAQAASVPKTTTAITTTSIPLSTQMCTLLKKEFPNHVADPQLCAITITHKVVTTPVSTVQPYAPTNCAPRNTATAYDQLSYSFVWTAELDTEYQNYGQGCTPALLFHNSYMTYVGPLTTASQSSTVYTINHTVTVMQNIDSTSVSISMHSCQERGFDGSELTWPYYSVLGGGCTPFN